MMGTRTSLIVLILAGVLAAPPLRSADAGEFKISPIRVDLSVDRPIGVLNVSNPSAEPLLLHLEVQAWDHVAGSDRYMDTRDVLLNPMIFELEPGQQQLVRIGLTRPASSERELAYRVFIREVPQRARQKKRQITTVLHVSLPVFVSPRKAGAPDLIWRLEQAGATGLALWVENRGGLHAKVLSIALRRPNGEPLAAIDRQIYVLPGQSRRLDIPGHLTDPDEPVTLTAESRDGPLRSALRLVKNATVEGALR